MKLTDTYESNSKYLKSEHFAIGIMPNGRVRYGTMTVKIVGVKSGAFQDGRKQRVLNFEGIDKELGLNVTNYKRIIDLTGYDDDDNWIGHEIGLYVDPYVQNKDGSTVPGVRVQEPHHATCMDAK